MERELRLPATLSTSFQGTVQAFQRSLQGLGLLLLAAVLVIYLILGILYESFIHPLTILSGLPSAGVGALLTLILFNQELNTSTASSSGSSLGPPHRSAGRVSRHRRARSNNVLSACALSRSLGGPAPRGPGRPRAPQTRPPSRG